MTSEKAAQPTLETILRPGQIVAGKYCVDHLIAAGGMAAVWSGANLRTGKRVALKVILQSFAATPGAEELFRREALAASRVNHPNVVTVFDVVDHAARTCIVMEYLDGEDLGAYFERQGLLGLDETVALLLPAMRGVAAANAQGVVHRDLKPKNIFLCVGPDGRVVTSKILDFGISVMAEKANERSKTVQLTTHGTPTYMSPEHITGSPHIDERADVYGFGVILFEALAGQAPYLGPAGPELLTRILEEPVPKLTHFRPDLPPQMDAIIERAIAKNPGDRFPTLNHFIAALEEIVLSRSSILRSLTPSAGVQLDDSASGPVRSADPVRFVRRHPSGEHEGATKALYVLSRPVPSPMQEHPTQPGVSRPEALEAAASGTAPPWDLKAAAVDALELSPGARSPSSTLEVAIERRAKLWRGAILATVVGLISLAVAWLVIPDPGHGREQAGRLREPVAPPPAPVPGPPVAAPTLPQPSLPTSTPSPVGEIPSLGLPREALDPIPGRMTNPFEELPNEALAWPPPHLEANPRGTRASSRTATRATSRNERLARGHAAAALAPGSATETTSQVTPPPVPPPVVASPPAQLPRAGQLSTDDF